METTLSYSRFFAATATAERRHAVARLSLAVLAGAGTEALFWHTGFGLNFWVWDLFVLGATVITLRRRTLRPTAWGAIAIAALLGFFVVRYASVWTLSIATPMTLVILAVLPFLVRDGYSLGDLSRLPGRALGSFWHAPGAALETVRLPSVAAGGGGGGVLRGITRGLLLGVPTAGLFTLLLGTDADFAQTLAHVRDELGDVVLFGLWSLFSAASYLFTHALHERREAQVAADAGENAPYRAVDGAAEEAAPKGRVSVITWAMVIGQVALVFALFAVANLHHLFGGHALVRAPGALTYATYLHSGFGELLFATVLAVCLVLAGHGLLRPRGVKDPLAPAVPGGGLLASLEAALLVLTGITVASCWQRLCIYEDAYGASHLRLGVAFVELGVLGVLALTLGKAIARRWTGHAGAVLAFAAVLATVASGFNADAYVARTNLDRAARGRSLDVAYLASLSGDARDVLDHPFVRGDAQLRSRLQSSFCHPREGDLRSLRGLGRCSGVEAAEGEGK